MEVIYFQRQTNSIRLLTLAAPDGLLTQVEILVIIFIMVLHGIGESIPVVFWGFLQVAPCVSALDYLTYKATN